MLEVERERKEKVMKMMTERMEKAIVTASMIHDGYTRKGDGVTPYIAHPVSVAMILSTCTDDQDVIIAGYLHDAIEDTGYKERAMKLDFGERVTKIVLEVTEKDKKASWDERKQGYIEGIKNKSLEACLVACADKISNARALISARERIGEGVWGSFKASKEKKLWYFRSVCEELEKRLQGGLICELQATLQELEGGKENV